MEYERDMTVGYTAILLLQLVQYLEMYKTNFIKGGSTMKLTYLSVYFMSIKLDKHSDAAIKAKRLGIKPTYFNQCIALIHDVVTVQFHSKRRIISHA